jgi:hypothetical protein
MPRAVARPRVLSAFFSILLPALSAAASPAVAGMLDPATDDPQREWCYLAKSTTVIGVPFQPDVTQVTFDGALFTRNAELCFFYGTPLRPLLARQKTFLEGWMPIVVYDWRDGPVRYAIEMFAAPLDEKDVSNTVNFVRVQLRNTSDRQAKGSFAAAMRQSGLDYRMGEAPLPGPACRYEMTADAVFRGNALVYTFPPGASRQAAPGEPYQEAFTPGRYCVTPRAEVCLARYEPDLAPGQAASLVFKMPRVPVPRSDAATVERVRTTDYDRHREWTVRYWKRILESGAVLEIPERRVQDAQRAGMVHLMLATRQRGGERFQTSGLPYPDLFANDFIDMRLAYDTAGHPEFAGPSIDVMIARWLKDADIDAVKSFGWSNWPTQGQVMHSIGNHYVMTQDKAYGRRVWPKMKLAVEILRKGLAADPFGLVPVVGPYDAEMIRGHYTSHNLWCLLGLRSAIVLARELGETADARAWLGLHDEFLARFLKALKQTAGDDGYVPTGVYSFLTGKKAGGGFAEFQTNCDWENMLLAHPTEVLAPQDPRVAATLNKVREGFVEGVMSYRHGMEIHQYVTTNVLHQHLVRGESKQALADLYHVLLHCGSTHEGFECQVRPWADRSVAAGCPTPHAWAAAKIALTVRNCMLYEHGGRAGLDEGRRDLYLFPAVSPAWAVPGRRIALRNAATEMGPITAEMAFRPTGAVVTIESRFHHPPGQIVLRIPYFVKLTSFAADARQSRLEDRAIFLSPDVKRVDLVWETDAAAHQGTFEDLLRAYRSENSFQGADSAGRPIVKQGKPFIAESEKRPGAVPLSFQVVLEAYRHEYAGRYENYRKAGGQPARVEAPALLTPAQRKAAFTAAYGDPETYGQSLGIAVGKTATASQSLDAYPPSSAVDGIVSLPSSWQATPYPQWWQVDLGREARIDRVHVHPYWGGGRYYQYTVETSTDGKTWAGVADMSKNKQPSTPAGDLHKFPPRPARYVKVNMLYHSLNEGVHLVEVKVLAAP